MNIIYSYFLHGINNDSPENFENILENLTADDIKQFAGKFFNSADVVDVTFVPKEE